MKELLRLWNDQDALSKFLIVSALSLVVFAYLPTIQFDYVTQDQWRAFRYSPDIHSFMARLQKCFSTIPEFYTRTGRPLVWPTECLEHAFVERISDFKYLRPLALVLVVSTVIYLSLIVSRCTRDWVTAIVVTGVFITAPAYSFMYLQGWPALMVLMSVVFASASYQYYSEAIIRSTEQYRSFIKSSIFFLAACMMYPAFAFIVLPLALMFFVSEIEISLIRRLQQLAITLFFYTLLSAVYYAIVKVSVLMLTLVKGSLPILGRYEVSAQFTPAVILEKIKAAAVYFFMMPPLNLLAFHGASFLVLLVFSIAAGIASLSIDRGQLYSKLAYHSIATFSVSVSVLLSSISPWLLSKMGTLATRHLLPFYLFLSFAMVWTIKVLLSSILQQDDGKIRLIMVTLVLLPIAIIQNSHSFLEVAATRAEIETLRAKVMQWEHIGGRANNRFILIVRPEKDRLLSVERLVHDAKYGNDNAVLASAMNPVSIPWMIGAIFRDESKDCKQNIVDCGFDTELCVQMALAHKNDIAVAYVYGTASPNRDVINCPVQPYVINLSELTSKPVTPDIRVVKRPSISATSVLDEYGPQGLFTQTPPAWHAEKKPKYPQALVIDFNQARSFRHISFLPQDQKLSSRAPKRIRIKVSDDGRSWVHAVDEKDICEPNSPEGWHTLELPKKIEARYVQVEILANCGDPTLLTLGGLKVE